jgi:hypothetical protein
LTTIADTNQEIADGPLDESSISTGGIIEWSKHREAK